jgi:glutathione S-transferase
LGYAALAERELSRMVVSSRAVSPRGGAEFEAAALRHCMIGREAGSSVIESQLRGAAMITIYHAKRARSARVIWLLEELGVPYQLEPVEFSRSGLRSPEHLQRHPLGQLPVVRVDDVSMFESGAIVQYLLEIHGQGRLEPALDSSQRASYLQWFHFGEASLAVFVSQIVRQRFSTPEAEQQPEIIRDGRQRLAAALAVIDDTLAQRPYICGQEFGAADIMVSYGIIMARIIKELPPQFGNLPGYLTRLKERPAYARAWG